MPGAETPADLALALATDPNDSAAAAALEEITEVQRRTLGVGESTPSTFTIATGSITPDRAAVRVDTEGAVSADFLDNIQTDNYLPGSLVMLSAADGSRVPTVRAAQGGDGQIFLAQGIEFELSGARWMLLELIGTIWIERFRSYAGNAGDMRSFLGLGTAATFDDGEGDAATLEGNAAADFLPVGGTAANASALGGLAAAVYARLDTGGQQDFLGALRTLAGQLSIVTTAAIAPVLRLVANSVIRVLTLFDPVSEEFEIRVVDADGTTQTGGIRIREGEPPDYWDSDADPSPAWVSLLDDPVLQAAFPALGRVVWDKLTPAEDLTPVGPATYVIHSEEIVPLPNTSGPIVYKIQAGLSVRIGGTNNVRGDFSIHIGQNGDQSDPLLATTEVNVNTLGTDYVLELEEVFDTYEAGDRVSLVFDELNIATTELQPSVDNGFTRDRLTFLRLEQIN